MSTKTLVLGAGMVAALALAPLAGHEALAQDEPIKLRISTAAVDSDWHAQALHIFEDWLDRSSPGTFDVEIHTNATLFKQGTEPIAMQRGNLEMTLMSMQDISKQIPELSIFTAGYLIRDPAHQWAVFTGEIGEEVGAQVSDAMGIELLAPFYLGTRQINLSGDKKITTPADMEGVKLRMPGSPTWQFLGEALGASPTPLAFPEVYTALQTGTIDGQDNPLPTDRAAKFYEVTDQIVLTSHLVDVVFLGLASSAYEAMSDREKTLVDYAANAAACFNNLNRILDEEDLIAFFKEAGLDVYEPDVEAFRTEVQAAYLESEFSQDWPEGMLDRVNAVESLEANTVPGC